MGDADLVVGGWWLVVVRELFRGFAGDGTHKETPASQAGLNPSNTEDPLVLLEMRRKHPLSPPYLLVS
jgi:hypothetical protein